MSGVVLIKEEDDDMPAPERQVKAVTVATGDTLIDRPDLGEGITTFVAAGFPIPEALVDLPRRPARPSRIPRAVRRKS